MSGDRSARYWLTPLGCAVIIAIGCGGGKTQDAAARPDAQPPMSQPVQLAEAPAATPTTGGGSASIKGILHFSGPVPTPEPIAMEADPVCQQKHPTPVVSDEVMVQNGLLKNAFVYLKEGVKGPFTPPTTPVVLDQNGCWYTPHISGIQAGQPLEITNSDQTMHNINAKPKANPPFNIAQAMPMKTTKTFSKPEVMVRFKCNVHPWMTAYLGVLEHPFFAVSGDDGSFTIANVPAGTYTVEAWHEKFGTQTQTVTVGEGEAKTVEFTFQAQ